MFSPKRKPDLTKYMLWTNSVHLTNPSCIIHELFNFDSQPGIISSNQYMYLRHWMFLLTSCNELAIVPPSFPLFPNQNLRTRKENE